MTITDLNNDYYLALNDIWVKLDTFTKQTARLTLRVENITTGKFFDFKLYPSPDNEFFFNICLPVRALFTWEQIEKCQTLHQFELTFSLAYNDGTTDSLILQKYFLWGGREQNSTDEWYLSASTPLIVGRWIQWGDIQLPGYAKRIQGGSIVDFVPSETYKVPVRGCDYKIVRFLNSLGGWQYFLFETYEVKNKTRPGKSSPLQASSLRKNNFRNLGADYERTITLHTKTPAEIQEVFTDLVFSTDVSFYNPSGNDEDSKWQRLVLESNDSVGNNFDKVYENKIEFSFSNNINRTY